MAELNLHALEHLPKWAWVVAAAGAIGVYLLYQRGSGTSSSSGTGSSVDVAPTPPGPTGGSSGTCPNYAVPSCPLGQQLEYQQDANNCPQPVCVPNSQAGQPDRFVTTDGSTSYYSASHVYTCWGDLTIKNYAVLHGEIPNAGAYGLYTALPAGHSLKVCGSQ